jgi:amidase
VYPWVNLTFAGKAYDDSALFKYAFAFEQATRLRQAPGRTPALSTDFITMSSTVGRFGDKPPHLTVEGTKASCKAGTENVRLSGTVDGKELSSLHIYVDGNEIDGVSIGKGTWSADIDVSVDVHWSDVKPEEKRVPDLGKVMVIVLATGKNGRSSAEMVFV